MKPKDALTVRKHGKAVKQRRFVLTRPRPEPMPSKRRKPHGKLKTLYVRGLRSKHPKALRSLFRRKYAKAVKQRRFVLTRPRPEPPRVPERPKRPRKTRDLFVKGLERRNAARRTLFITRKHPKKPRKRRFLSTRPRAVPAPEPPPEAPPAVPKAVRPAKPAAERREKPPSAILLPEKLIPENPPDRTPPQWLDRLRAVPKPAEPIPEAAPEKPEPMKPEPMKPEPVTPEPVSPKPAKPEPVKPEAAAQKAAEPETPKPEEPAKTDEAPASEEPPEPAEGDTKPSKRRKPKRLKKEDGTAPKRKRRQKPKRLIQPEEEPLTGWRRVAAWMQWVLFFTASFAFGTAVAAAVEAVRTGSLEQARLWASTSPGSMALTALLCGTAAALLGSLTGRLWLSGFVVSALTMAAALVNYFKISINGTPLVLSDFGLAGQAGQVAGVAGNLRPPQIFWQAAVALAGIVLLLRVLGPLFRVRGKRFRFLRFSTALILAAALFTRVPAVALGTRFQVDMETRLDPFASQNAYGLAVSLWRELFLQRKDAPRGYGVQYMNEVLSWVDRLVPENAPLPENPPNVIVVLSESFFDPTRLPGIEYDQDPVSHYHALQKEGISGHFFSHYLGYGTGYIEAAMHMGFAEPDLIPGTNICFMDPEYYEQFHSLAEQYTDTGLYRAEMLHGFDNSLYRRVQNYPMWGYEKSLYADDIKKLGLDRPGGMYGGYYMNDAFFFQAMLHEMEAINAQGSRAFLYGITMENHQPFNPDKFSYVHHIEAKSKVLNEKEMAVFQAGLEGLYRADLGLGELTDALRNSPEPTIVAFFGDHRPTLPMPDGETVYTHLGLSPGSDTTEWTREQLGDLYSSDYLIWANDAALLQGLAGTERPSGVLALGPQVLELTGVPVSRYWGLMALSAKVELVRTEIYFADGAGRAFRNRESAHLTESETELLRLRDSVIYDALYGQRFITEAMNDPPGAEIPDG